VSHARPRGPIVIDTDAFSADLVPRAPQVPNSGLVYAQLRADCEARGHVLAQRAHTPDGWIAATAIRLGVPLVSNDKIFRDLPSLDLESLAGRPR